MLILGWDGQGNAVHQLIKAGARYIWQISFDPSNQTAIFIGQAMLSVQATLQELLSSPSPNGPTITTLNQATFPSAPADWNFFNITSPDVLTSDPLHYPVVIVQGITYTGRQSEPLDCK